MKKENIKPVGRYVEMKVHWGVKFLTETYLNLPGLNENIRRLTANCYRKGFNRNIFMKIAIIILNPL